MKELSVVTVFTTIVFIAIGSIVIFCNNYYVTSTSYMKKIIYLLAWIGLALASCSDESSLPIQPEIPAEPETPKDEPAPEKDYHQLPVLHVEGALP